MTYWIWLTQIKGIGPVYQRMLLKRFKNPEGIYAATEEELLSCKGIGKDKASEIRKKRSLDPAKKVLETANSKNIKFLTLYDPLYPQKAKDISDTPILLYYRGKIIEDCMGVAIVGARRCSDYGKSVAKEAAAYLAKNHISVISGMAKGIDGYAHTACLKEGGYTIAFLGNGVDICYPYEHSRLMEEIIQNGAVISEYPPGVAPNNIHFPKRNQLISAWAHKVFIIEAGRNSGSLITADFSLQQKRTLLVAPDNIYRNESIGSNELLLKGATAYLNPRQLFIENTINKTKPQNITIQNDNQENTKKQNELTRMEIMILDIFKKEGQKSVEELSLMLKVDKMEVISTLALLDLK